VWRWRAVFHVNISTHKTKFTNNLAKVDGGAILSNKSGIANISETNFTDNSNNAPDDCGGAMHVFNSTLMISNSNFNRNLAVNGHGGALCLQEGTNYLSDCDFNFNEAETFGGAIYTRNSQHEYLTRCSFDTNTIKLPSGGGRSMRMQAL
jgi:predicted outer membrane repeat protein